MAWKAKVTAKNPDHKAGEVVLNVAFFDDAEPGTVLHSQQFRFAPSASRAELVAAIRRAGAEAASRRERVQALHDQIPAEFEMTV